MNRQNILRNAKKYIKCIYGTNCDVTFALQIMFTWQTLSVFYSMEEYFANGNISGAVHVTSSVNDR